MKQSTLISTKRIQWVLEITVTQIFHRVNLMFFQWTTSEIRVMLSTRFAGKLQHNIHLASRIKSSNLHVPNRKWWRDANILKYFVVFHESVFIKIANWLYFMMFTAFVYAHYFLNKVVQQFSNICRILLLNSDYILEFMLAVWNLVLQWNKAVNSIHVPFLDFIRTFYNSTTIFKCSFVEIILLNLINEQAITFVVYGNLVGIYKEVSENYWQIYYNYRNNCAELEKYWKLYFKIFITFIEIA